MYNSYQTVPSFSPLLLHYLPEHGLAHGRHMRPANQLLHLVWEGLHWWNLSREEVPDQQMYRTIVTLQRYENIDVE